MSMFKRTRREIPGLNTSSLPDLIFTVLFFFMIVTHMRKVTLKVKYQVPQGTELTRLTKKTAVSYIYIGKPVTGTVQGRLAEVGRGRKRGRGLRRPEAPAAGNSRFCRI